MKYKKVFAVMTRNPFNGTHLHREAFDTLKDAQEYCENCNDCPRKVSQYRYESPIVVYTICELEIEVKRR